MLPKSNEDNQIYLHIRDVLLNARQKAYTAVNFAMVEAYWTVGKMIVEAQSGNERCQKLIIPIWQQARDMANRNLSMIKKMMDIFVHRSSF